MVYIVIGHFIHVEEEGDNFVQANKYYSTLEICIAHCSIAVLFVYEGWEGVTIAKETGVLHESARRCRPVIRHCISAMRCEQELVVPHIVQRTVGRERLLLLRM
jgi:spore maturation protein SpmA